MPAGAPGDHPLTDILDWGLHPLTQAVSQLVHDLAAVMPRDALFEAITWLPMPSPAEAHAQLFQLLQARRAEAAVRGWDGHSTRAQAFNRTRALQVQASIRQVLLTQWDPLQIAGEARAQDEYDGYIGRLYHLIAAGKPAAALAAELAGIEEELGVHSAPQGLLAVAKNLAQLDVRLGSPGAA